MVGSARQFGGGAEASYQSPHPASRAAAWRRLRQDRHKIRAKWRNVSGDGDSRRRIDATSGSGDAIINGSGWTAVTANRMLFLGLLKGARITSKEIGVLRIDVAALKACTGVIAFCWAMTGIASSAGSGPSIMLHSAAGKTTGAPSILMLATQTGLAGTCGGSVFYVNTFIDVTAQASADVKVSALGVTIEEFVDETGKNIGPYDDFFPLYQINPFGGGLAPNTLISVSVTTYAGPNLSGSITFVSTLVFNCTTGAVILAQPPLSAVEVPALGLRELAATAVLLLLVGTLILRGRRVGVGIASTKRG